ncbi:MAG: alkaline phosphatase D family protein [Caldimicrobium sp.]|nr:alkaline phosphatase D family protein [Caldimicrobium sp.]MCX7613823.1 alkaline phosphatase D family protein [Caldimicrobium sp.]MDW8182650.1 alkaline phosphatase D family protein [Caldimicrobium sp.]
MITRREFLELSGATLLLLYLNQLSFAMDTEEIFPQGVASGDPTQRGIVLWTRLNPKVHRCHQKDLVVQIAENPEFKEVLSKKIPAISINEKEDFTVRIDLDGSLRPGRTYYYRFLYAGVPSMTGRFKTLPERAKEISMAFVVCQNYPDGLYTAYAHLAKEDLQMVVHLGDFIYEKIYGPARVPGRDLSLPSGEKVSVNLEDYRYLYRTYLSDPNLRLARAMHPFVNTWDDHEFLNDYYYDYERKVWGYFVEGHPVGEERAKILRLRQAAVKAWIEYIPSRVKVNMSDEDPLKWVTIYRDFDLGGLGKLIVLDERSYREKPPCSRRFAAKGCPEQEKTSMLGKEQLKWCTEKLLKGSEWKVIANSVQFSRSQTDGMFGSLDAWDGYAGERRKILELLGQKGIKKLIFISGDRHASMVAEIPNDYEKPSQVLGAEFVTPALSSINAMEGGWWRRSWSNYKSLEELQWAEMSQNPWIKHINSINCWGYSVLTLKPDRVECTIYSIDKYRENAEKVIDACFLYRPGLLEKA